MSLRVPEHDSPSAGGTAEYSPERSEAKLRVSDRGPNFETPSGVTEAWTDRWFDCPPENFRPVPSPFQGF